MTSVRSEVPELLEIPEQNLRLINEIKPYFNKYGDLYVIIAREIDFRNGMNYGNLRVGIIRLSNNNEGFEVVLPFSKNLLYATIKDGIVELAYVQDKVLKTSEIPLSNDGKLNFLDYAFLLDGEEQYTLSLKANSR